jgi:hypothetical protein
VLHKPGIAGRGAGRPRVAAPFPRCDRVILYLHDLRQFPARLHHVRVRARLTVKTIAVASASAVPQKKAPSAAIFGVGFAFPNYDVAWKAMDGDLGAYCRGLSETVGLYCMDKAFDHGFREITMKSKPINMPDDLKGVKIRLPVAPLFIALFQHFGASPTPINFGEVYSALQTGLVDGQENPLILIDNGKALRGTELLQHDQSDLGRIAHLLQQPTAMLAMSSGSISPTRCAAASVQAYPAETTEAFCDGHNAAFGFFGRVPVDPPRQYEAGGGAYPGRWDAAADAGVQRAAIPLPARRPFWPSG